MPKRAKEIFKNAITYEKLYSAYKIAMKGKRFRIDIIKFGLRKEEFILSICKLLQEDTFEFKKYNKFYVYEPKLRRILSAPFRDRIVNTWYVKNFIEKIFVPKFIDTSYACLIDKGVHKCTTTIKNDIYKLSRKWKNAYIIKMDVAKYFQSVDRQILIDIISRSVKDKDFLAFTKKLLESSSLYDDVDGIGLPIGNFSSQMFGNIFLNEVDQYAKRVLKCKYYYRYMDDTCIICESKEKAQDILQKLTLFYNDVLHLRLNKKTDIFKLTQGINFCGYKIKIGQMRIKPNGKRRLVKKLKKVRFLLKEGEISIDKAKMLIAGHVGYMSNANIIPLAKKYFLLSNDKMNITDFIT